ncbi:unnamed protein product [Rotaria sp. Silwood1]|nr:unnamed protein product [Rotaria sp. Silwood1]CAF3736577.1 unnamed protein product [Rotaria sp. Silwood1]CAF3737783.1 unnamed protein product [Rotaria sp. Silwood1]
MDQSRTFTKLLRVLQFQLTNACKRINKDGCYEFVTAKTEPLATEKKSTKFNIFRSKKRRNKNSYNLSTQIQTNMECITVDNHEQPLKNMNSYEHLSNATPTSPANLSMIISQSYKPLYAKSTQFNKNTIAVTKGTHVKGLYKMSNWVFIEIPETGATGFIPIYCIRLHDEPTKPSFESPSQNNISLFNVSIYDKPRYSRLSIVNNRSYNMSTPRPGLFISSIGPCYLNNETQISKNSRLTKRTTFTRSQIKDESVLSQQISNMSLHTSDKDAYETLNLTPRKNLSISVLDNESVIFRPNNRLRVIENYQRQFVGDISVLESEVVTLVNSNENIGDWRLIKRGDGQQGYIPEHIVVLDRNFT